MQCGPSGRPNQLTAKMKLGLYSITYLGIWYRGKALTLPELIQTAKRFGYDGVEIDGKRPHGNPLDWPTRRCQELRSLAAGEGIAIQLDVHGSVAREESAAAGRQTAKAPPRHDLPLDPLRQRHRRDRHGGRPTGVPGRRRLHVLRCHARTVDSNKDRSFPGRTRPGIDRDDPGCPE